MKERIIQHTQALVNDRHLLVALLLLLLAGVSLLVFLAFGIDPTERQVAVHYTSFGTTNFYREKWYYLLSFAVYVVVLMAVHSVITLKILQEKGRELAVVFAWMGLVLVVISAALLFQILKVASII
jgi:hypothetical protein|tara:strand:+ start:17231 stop:17608 length:378 start_codon:yes stop_codon:yes gene_type:complete